MKTFITSNGKVKMDSMSELSGYVQKIIRFAESSYWHNPSIGLYEDLLKYEKNSHSHAEFKEIMSYTLYAFVIPKPKQASRFAALDDDEQWAVILLWLIHCHQFELEFDEAVSEFVIALDSFEFICEQ